MVTMDERAPSFFEKLAVKGKKEPLVPIGALATVGFLVSGMYVNVNVCFQEHAASLAPNTATRRQQRFALAHGGTRVSVTYKNGGNT